MIHISVQVLIPPPKLAERDGGGRLAEHSARLGVWLDAVLFVELRACPRVIGDGEPLLAVVVAQRHAGLGGGRGVGVHATLDVRELALGLQQLLVLRENLGILRQLPVELRQLLGVRLQLSLKDGDGLPRLVDGVVLGPVHVILGGHHQGPAFRRGVVWGVSLHLLIDVEKVARLASAPRRDPLQPTIPDRRAKMKQLGDGFAVLLIEAFPHRLGVQRDWVAVPVAQVNPGVIVLLGVGAFRRQFRHAPRTRQIVLDDRRLRVRVVACVHQAAPLGVVVPRLPLQRLDALALLDHQRHQEAARELRHHLLAAHLALADLLHVARRVRALVDAVEGAPLLKERAELEGVRALLRAVLVDAHLEVRDLFHQQVALADDAPVALLHVRGAPRRVQMVHRDHALVRVRPRAHARGRSKQHAHLARVHPVEEACFFSLVS